MAAAVTHLVNYWVGIVHLGGTICVAMRPRLITWLAQRGSCVVELSCSDVTSHSIHRLIAGPGMALLEAFAPFRDEELARQHPWP